MASPRRAARKCKPTLITFTSSTISRLCLNCRTDWSLVLEGQLLLHFPLCQPDCRTAKEQSLAVSSLSLRTPSAIKGRCMILVDRRRELLNQETLTRDGNKQQKTHLRLNAQMFHKCLWSKSPESRAGQHHPTAELQCQQLHSNSNKLLPVGKKNQHQQLVRVKMLMMLLLLLLYFPPDGRGWQVQSRSGTTAPLCGESAACRVSLFAGEVLPIWWNATEKRMCKQTVHSWVVCVKTPVSEPFWSFQQQITRRRLTPDTSFFVFSVFIDLAIRSNQRVFQSDTVHTLLLSQSSQRSRCSLCQM